VWLALIILLGFVIRGTGLWWGQGYCYIGPSDALEAYSVAVDYARGEPRSEYLGQPNYNRRAKLPGPLWSLFCLTGLRACGSIEGAVLGIILLNTAAIYVCYLLAERTLSAPGSTLTALLAATLPFAVYYSVSLYNPNVMPLLGGVLFVALWEVIQRDRSRSIFWVVMLLLVMPQFHMCVTMLLPAVGFVLLLSSVRLNVPWLFAGFLAGALLYVPYFRGEMSNGWHNTLGMMTAPGRYGFGGLKALTAPLSLLTNWVPQWTANWTAYLQLGRACFGWVGIFVALNLLSVIVAALMVLRVAQQVGESMRGFLQAPRQVFNASRALLFHVFVVAIPLLCAAISGKNFRSHYAIVLFAPLLALAGWAAASLISSPRLGKWFAATLIMVICGNAWFMPAMFRYQGIRIDKGEVFLASFRNLETIYQQLKAHAGSERGVKVDDRTFYQEVQGHEEQLSDALLISRYVAIREKEYAMLSCRQMPPVTVTYTLRRAEAVNRRDPAVAYRQHGIELLVAPAPP
jgi:hypothetical protein